MHQPACQLTLSTIPSTCISDVSSSKITQDEMMIGSMVLGLLPIKPIITAENGTCLRVVESKKISAQLGQDASFIAVIVSPIIWIRTQR
jgi:hypothetical protein